MLEVNGRPLNSAGILEANGVLRFSLPVRAGDRIELRAALSTVDAVSARDTLDRDLARLSLTQLVKRTRHDWNTVLSRIEFDAPPARRSLFYTCLFRALQMPARIDDSSGAYRDSRCVLRHAPAGHHRYSGWSLWDNYRTQVPLVALVAPDVGGDVADSLVDLFLSGKAQWSGPNEPFLSVRTEHAGIALLDLHRKGLGRTDPAVALSAMAAETARLPQATPDERLELAYDQWAVAELASDMGRADTARDFRSRALAYRALWLSIFRDLGDDADVVKARGLYQGTLWQYRWAPVFDLDWLREQALGPARFDAELSAFFDRGLFNMTNEPDIHAPFLFALTADSSRMDAIVARWRDRAADHWYENQRKYDRPIHQLSFSHVGFAEGMDDDGGAMSAWYVWASLGLYPLVPGKPVYTLSFPAASRSVIYLPNGQTFTIRRVSHGRQHPTLVRRDGRPLLTQTLRHDDLVAGGVLTFQPGR